MKYFLILLSAGLFSLNSLSIKSTLLSGKVTDADGEALIGATIKVLKGDELVRGTITDYEGKYSLALDPGTYDLEFSYTGYESQRIVGVVVLADQTNSLNASLSVGSMLNEVVVTSFKVPLIEQDKTSGGMTLTSDEIRPISRASEGRAVRREKSKDLATPAMATPAGTDDVKVKGARSAAKDYYIDGIRVDGAAPPPVEVKPALMMDRLEESPARSDDLHLEEPAFLSGGPAGPAPRAGLLTAGEWNDLHNWSHHWADLQTDGETDAYQKQYQFFPKNRYSVLLQNEQNLPVSDAVVQLFDKKGAMVWEARTDNMGRAELWNGMFGSAATGDFSITVWMDGKKTESGRAKPFSEGLNHLKIQRECQHSANVDIVWTVDATGSMGDEIEYLKTELLDVIGRVKATNPDLALRMGSVFYRDQGDEYLVKSSTLNYDVAKTVDYIRKQSADGGGDYPEAVHSALEEAIYRQPWSRDAVARICFLVLDASPHQDPAVIESLQKSVREAAKKGIRIVPVSASGIQKDTEFLMKFFGLATNGTYVFLTDHSGIGGKHIEPTTDEYKVELLNDLLVRLITEYSTVPTCDGKSTIRFEDPQIQAGQQQHGQNDALEPIVYYPNPASTQFSVELPFDTDKVALYDAEGKAVRTFARLASGRHTVQVQDLPAGYYTLRVWKGKQVQSGKVMVVRV